jgi:hypothetical protein
MGYGLVLIGYALTFFTSLTLYGWLFRLLGYAAMAYGLFKLKDYFPFYKLSLFAVLALFLTGIGEAGAEIFSSLGKDAELFKTVVFYTRDALVLVFHVLFLIATYIAYGVVGMTEKKVNAVTDICAVVLGYVFYILAALKIVEGSVAIFVQLIWTVMVFFLIFGCYMRICPEGDESMPRRESKIPFINKFSEALEKREAEAVERTRRDIEEKKKKVALGTSKKKHKKRR